MIRRLITDDCAALSAWLADQFVMDPASGGTTAPTTDFLIAQVDAGIQIWVSLQGTVLNGVLGPAMYGGRPEGTFVYFNRLVVDYRIYQVSRAAALKIAKDLTIAAANDIQAEGSPDYVFIAGPTLSRGASFARLQSRVGEETTHGSEAAWLIPFSLIWERAQAAA